MATYFDNLPVELLHMIFQFLSHSDVIWSFSDLSLYLNSVVNNYNSSSLNLQSIPKSRFDLICHHLTVERILSLTLSDDFQTPGQVHSFFTRFHLRDFIHLRSLTLLSITNDDLSLISSDLPKLKDLKRLITQCRSTEPLFLGQILNQLKSLKHLSVSQGDIFDHTIASPLHHLKDLNAGICNFLELRRLQIIVPSLISLKINLQANHQLQLLVDSKIWASLERLDLTLTDQTTVVTFNEIEQFLSHFSNLISLTLNIRGLADHLADGNRWANCSTINQLEKFDFLIEFDHAPINHHRVTHDIFNSFSTPFWQKSKRWYVVITMYHLFTISSFTEQLCLCSTSPPLSTSPDYRWFYSKIKRIQIDTHNSSINLNQFPNLQILDFPGENLPLSLKQYPRLHHLIFHRSISHQVLTDLLISNPQIDYLTLSQTKFQQFLPLKTILYLHLQASSIFISRTQIKDLARVFPLVKQLFLHLNSTKLICRVINSFHRLENAVFHFRELTKPISTDWLKENTRLNNETSSFTCRTEPNRFVVWIDNSTKPIVPLKEKLAETFELIPGQQTEKCSLQ